MMQPIRWDNVAAPSGAPAQTLESAARMLNNALGAFQTPLVQAEATQARNWETGRTNNTLDARAALMQFADAKRFKQAMDGGQVASIINQYGAQADRAALMDFADSRLPTLQQRDVQGIQYKNTMLDDAQAKSRDRILGMINSGNSTLIDRAMQELPGMDLRIKADIYQRGNEAQRRQIDLAHADESHLWEKQKMDAQIQRWKDETSIGRANVDVNRQQVANQRTGMLQQFLGHLEDASLKLSQASAKTSSVTATSDEGRAILGTALSSLKDPATQRNAAKAAADFVQANPDAPASVLDAGIRSINQRWYRSDEHIREEMTATMASLMEAAKKDPSAKGKGELRNSYQTAISKNEATQDTVKRQLFAALFPTATGAMPGMPAQPRPEPGGKLMRNGSETVVVNPPGPDAYTYHASAAPDQVAAPATPSVQTSSTAAPVLSDLPGGNEYASNRFARSVTAAQATPSPTKGYNEMTPEERKASYEKRNAPALALQSAAEKVLKDKQRVKDAEKIKMFQKDMEKILDAERRGLPVNQAGKAWIVSRLKELSAE